MSTAPLDIDILLYVALSEEFDVVLTALTEDLQVEFKSININNLALQISIAIVWSPVLKKDLKLGFVLAGKMGNTRAATVVSAILSQSNCNNVVVLGIAGSLADELQPGDVLIPDSIIEYLANSSTEDIENNKTWRFKTSGNNYQTSPYFLNQFQLLKSIHKDYFKHWETDCKSRYNSVATAEIRAKMRKAGFTMRAKVKLFVGDDQKLASGPTVGKSKEFTEWLISQIDRKLVAIDMESAGVYDAAAIRFIPPRVLSIRGISDFADHRKKQIEEETKGQFRKMAVRNAFSLLLRGIEAGFFEAGVIPQKVGARGAENDKWARIRQSSNEWLDQIHTTLPNGLALPRVDEVTALRKAYADGAGAHLLGESGSGKSALLKLLATNAVDDETEVVWIKAEHFSALHQEIPDFADILLNTECSSGLLVIDSLENCYIPDQLEAIGRFVATISRTEDSIWKVFLSCQTLSWSRVLTKLIRNLSGQQVLSERIEYDNLSYDDFEIVLKKVPAIQHLAQQRRMERFLRSPKMLDLILRNESGLNRLSIGETDVIEWWWDEQVKSGKHFSGKEDIARTLAIYLADSLTSEASPDVVKHDHEATNSLIKKQILSRTKNGQIRFDHDLLADWSRVMHLRSLGSDVLNFIREHSENPPWLIAVRLLSQHFLERISDRERWQSIVDECTVASPNQQDLESRDLLILDVWLEGIAYCSDPLTLLERNRDQLFAKNAWLLKRLLRRLLHNATFPDPYIKNLVQQHDPSTASSAALHYRLPVVRLWLPFVSFLVANPEKVIEFLPVTLAKLGIIWGRIEAYCEINWSSLAELIIINGEKELRREVGGMYRHNNGARSLGGGKSPRATIYLAALGAASQHPDRVSKLALKAAGRREWDEEDLTNSADAGWRGEWHEESFLDRGGSRSIYPVESWSDGPYRSISRDFYQAWFEANASLPLFKSRPADACEVTLAFLIDWPKTNIRNDDHSFGNDRHGFSWEENCLKSAFWSSGPFIGYLRANWRPAVDLVIRLTNFATDRYEERWSLSPAIEAVMIKTLDGEIEWKGDQHVFAWNRYHMSTSPVVTCALMALEKWLYEKIEAGESVAEPIHLLFHNGKSLALAGVLICIGKRYATIFAMDIQPLLFARELYTLDLITIQQNASVGILPFFDSEYIFNMKRDWNELPGRKIWLKDACKEWMLTQPVFSKVFEEVSSTWKREAEDLPVDSPERKQVERWAVEFDPQLWKQTELEDGKIEFVNERLMDFNDANAEQDFIVKQELLMLPFQYTEILEKRQTMNTAACEYIWGRLQNKKFFDRAKKLCATDPEISQFADERNVRAGLIAVITCMGEEWLQQQPSKLNFVDAQIWNILNNSPEITFHMVESTHDDYESFLARAVVRRWAANVNDPEWRVAVARFVASFRYRTVGCLFDEAFKCRGRLGAAYRELEAFALSFSSILGEATKTNFLGTKNDKDELISTWVREWVPRFSKGEGPQWTDNWASIEVNESPVSSGQNSGHGVKATFTLRLNARLKNVLRMLGIGTTRETERPSPTNIGRLEVNSSQRREHCRTAYGLEMGVILASFGHLPRLQDASDSSEREHWITICREMLAAFHRTLPLTESSDDAKWDYDIWPADEKVFEIAAGRLFECSADEGRDFWQSILNLPSAAHHYIEEFLNIILLEAQKTKPPNIEQLIHIWIPCADHLAAQDIQTNKRSRGTRQIWKVILLFGTLATPTGEVVYAPLVQKLAVYYRNYLAIIRDDLYDQSTFIDFLTTEAAAPIFINALEWLHDGWKGVRSNFWEKAVERGSFERLLEFGWSNRFEEIQKNPNALAAFKTLTLNLAAHNSVVAIDIQSRIGSSDTK